MGLVGSKLHGIDELQTLVAMWGESIPFPIGVVSFHQDNASKLLLALMESRHDSENAERILISLRPQELVRTLRKLGGFVHSACGLAPFGRCAVLLNRMERKKRE